MSSTCTPLRFASPGISVNGSHSVVEIGRLLTSGVTLGYMPERHTTVHRAVAGQAPLRTFSTRGSLEGVPDAGRFAAFQRQLAGTGFSQPRAGEIYVTSGFGGNLDISPYGGNAFRLASSTATREIHSVASFLNWPGDLTEISWDIHATPLPIPAAARGFFYNPARPTGKNVYYRAFFDVERHFRALGLVFDQPLPVSLHQASRARARLGKSGPEAELSFAVQGAEASLHRLSMGLWEGISPVRVGDGTAPVCVLGVTLRSPGNRWMGWPHYELDRVHAWLSAAQSRPRQ